MASQIRARMVNTPGGGAGGKTNKITITPSQQVNQKNGCGC